MLIGLLLNGLFFKELLLNGLLLKGLSLKKLLLKRLLLKGKLNCIADYHKMGNCLAISHFFNSVLKKAICINLSIRYIPAAYFPAI